MPGSTKCTPAGTLEVIIDLDDISDKSYILRELIDLFTSFTNKDNVIIGLVPRPLTTPSSDTALLVCIALYKAIRTTKAICTVKVSSVVSGSAVLLCLSTDELVFVTGAALCVELLHRSDTGDYNSLLFHEMDNHPSSFTSKIRDEIRSNHFVMIHT